MSILASHRIKLEVDHRLEYTHDNFWLKLQPRGHHPSHIECLKTEPFPKPYILAYFAVDAYEKVEPNRDYDYRMPEGWTYLTQARQNRGWRLWTNGYLGSAYCNVEKQQVVVAHQGTLLTNPGSVRADKHLWKEEYGCRMMSAVTFAHFVLEKIEEVNKNFGCNYSISFTGHSLGGYFAQTTTFTAEYLERYGDHFVRKTGKNFWHPHTVAIESPGCREMLEKMRSDLDVRYDPSMSINGLDITTYLSPPNFINSSKLHVGTVLRIFTDLSKMNILDKNTPKYHFFTHDSAKILNAFDPKSGEPYDVTTVVDWPKGLQEYNTYHKHTKHSQRYHHESINPLHDTITCSLRVFDSAEIEFLQHWKRLKQTEVRLKIFEDFFCSLGFNKDLDEVIPKFEFIMGLRKISVASKDCLDVLVRHTKNLMRWYKNEITDTLEKQTKEVCSQWKTMYREESKMCIESIGLDEIEFEVSEEIVKFLISNKNLLVYKCVKNKSLETIRIHSTLKKHKGSDCFFLSWEKLVQLNNYLNVSYLETEKEIVLVIDLSSNILDKTLLDKILNKKSWKIILLLTPKVLDSFNRKLEYDECNSQDFKLSHLTIESQSKIFERDICFANKTLKLKDLFPEEIWNDTQSTELLEDIILQSNLLTLGGDLSDICDLEVSHVRLSEQTTFMEFTEFLLKENDAIFVVICNDEEQYAKISSNNRLIRKEYEEDFIEICKENPEKTVYLIQVENEVCNYLRVYDPNFYISRKFSNKIFMKEKFYEVLCKQDIPDLFLFRNVTNVEELQEIFKKSIQSNNLIFGSNVEAFETIIDYIFSPKDGTKNSETEDIKFNYSDVSFKHMKHFSQNSQRPIHLLVKNEDNKIYWLKSTVCLDSIRDYVGYSEEVDENDFIASKDKVVIVADEPGMGKSTTLTCLSQKICKRDESPWVIRINFRDTQNAMRNLAVSAKIDYDENKNLSLDEVVDFLLNHKSSKLERDILKIGLQGRLKHTPFLLFDGFDEIEEIGFDGKRKVAQTTALKLLLFLKNETKAVVWVTTRKYPSNLLENTLSTFAKKFQKISEEQQIDFFVKFWKTNPKNLKNNENLAEFARNILDAAKTILGEEITNFIGVPLQLRMLAEVFQSDLQETSLRNHIENVTDLYQKFIKIKYDIYLSHKTEISDKLNRGILIWLIEAIDVICSKLGFRSVFPDFAKLPALREEEEEELNKVGLVQTGGKGDLEFIHRTFGEYFAADYIRRRLNGDEMSSEGFCRFLLEQAFVDRKYKVVRLFLNHMIDKCEMDDFEGVLTVKGRNFLHVFSEETLRGCMRWVIGLKCFNCQFFAEKDIKWSTPLNIAAGKNDEYLLNIICSYLMSRSTEEIETVIISSVYKYNGCHSEKGVQNLINYIKRNSEQLRPMSNCLEMLESKSELIEDILKTASDPLGTQNMQHLLETTYPKILTKHLINVGNENRQTPLHLSSQFGIESTVMLLLEQNADINARDKESSTPFLLATKSNELNVIGALYEAGSEVNSRDIFNMTPLAWASRSGYISVVLQLLDWQADLTLGDKNGLTPFLHAAKQGHLQVVEILRAKGAKLEGTDRYGLRALSWAAKCGHERVVNYLLSVGADAEARDAYGSTPLILAAKGGHCGVVRVLVEKGICLEAKDVYGATALLVAIKAQKWDVVKLLVKLGVNVNAKDDNGTSALQRCVNTGKKDMCQFLKDSGALS